MTDREIVEKLLVPPLRLKDPEREMAAGKEWKVFHVSVNFEVLFGIAELTTDESRILHATAILKGLAESVRDPAALAAQEIGIRSQHLLPSRVQNRV